MADRKKTDVAPGDGRSGRNAPDEIRLLARLHGDASHPGAVAVTYDPIPQSLLALAEELEDALTVALAETREKDSRLDWQRQRKRRRGLH